MSTPTIASVAPKRAGAVLGTLILVAAVANLPLAVANVALPDIGLAFDASQTQLNLVAVGYSLGLAASVLWLGAVGDRYGRKRMLLIGVLLSLPACLVAAWAPAAPASPDWRVTDLRCEYGTNPLGVDTPAPRLSWRLESQTQGQKQTACQILAASSRALLDRNSKAGVVDTDFQRLPPSAAADQHPAFGCVFDGVGDQVLQQPAQQHAIR